MKLPRVPSVNPLENLKNSISLGETLVSQGEVNQWSPLAKILCFFDPLWGGPTHPPKKKKLFD